MEIDELKEYMQDVVKNKGIEIRKRGSNAYNYMFSYSNGIDEGHILLAKDILKLIEIGEIS